MKTRWHRRLVLLLAGLLALVTVLLARTLLIGHGIAPATGAADTAALDVDGIAGHLADAVRFATVSRDGGVARSDVLAAQRRWLESAYPLFSAQATREVLAGGTIVYRWQGSTPSLRPIVLMAHQDVVPADDAGRWRHPPFAGVLDQGVVWGRGAIDDKSSLVSIMEAAESLAAADYRPSRSIILVFGHDEETAGSGASRAAALLKAQGVRPWFVLDEGSLAIRDHPVTHGPVALLGIAEKGYMTLRLVVRKPGGHSSAPPEDSAVAVLSRAVLTLTDNPFPRRYSGATRAMLEALAPAAPFVTRLAIANAWLFGPVLKAEIGSTPQGAAMLHTTMAPTMLQGSAKENVLASVATATINVRIAPEQRSQDILAHARGLLRDLPVAVELVGPPKEPSPVSPVDSASYRLIAGVTAAHFAMPVAPAPVIAGTDSRFMADVTQEIYRFQPILLSLNETTMLHGANERIATSQLVRMVHFYRSLMQQASAPGADPEAERR